MCVSAQTARTPCGKLAQARQFPAAAVNLSSHINVLNMQTPALPDGASAPLSAVLATEELFRRPARPPDYEAESRALAALAQELSSSPPRHPAKLLSITDV